MTLRNLVSMQRGLVDWQIQCNKVRRLENLWVCANIIAAICSTAGKTCERPPNAKTIFDQLSGEEPPDADEIEDDGDGGSLSALIAERKAREAAAKANGDTI